MKNFELKCVSGPFGDCTSNYEVVFHKPYTVREFVSEVLENVHEWGDFRIVEKGYPFGSEVSEYRYGKILTKFSDETLSRTIKSVKANGGWSNMTYYITLEN